MPLPFTRQELHLLLVVGITGWLGLTVLLVTRAVPPPAPPPALSINRATVEELAALRGIGPATARRIIAERTQHGRFLTVRELARVRGLSPRVIRDLSAELTVE